MRLRHRFPRHALAAAALTLVSWHAAGQTASFDLPAQQLADALRQFASQSGVQLVFAPELGAGRRSQAVRGTQDAEAALQQLLRGTGLRLRRDGATWTVEREPAASGAGAALAPVTVTAAAERSGATEGTGSYRPRYSSAATGLALSARETPQTVTVVTRQQMDDFGMASVDEALKAASGVFVYESAGNGTDYYSRGFALQTQYDGVPNPIGISQSNRNPLIDTAFLDRVEVVQGAAGLTAGAGTPGGTINLVRKRPTESWQAQAELQLGSWQQWRLVGDLSGPLVASGRIRGRLVAVADRSDSFVDYVYNHRSGVYAVVEADVSPTTLLSASLQYQRDAGRNHLGVPFAADGSDLGLRRSAYFGAPNGKNTKDYTVSSVGLEQKLAGDWRLKASFMHGSTDVEERDSSWTYGDVDKATGEGLQIYQSQRLARRFRSNAFEAAVSGPVQWFGRRHELAFGANGASLQTESRSAGYTPVDINAYHFDPATLPRPVAGNPYGDADRTLQRGVYGVARLSLADPLKLIVGTRVSWYENKNLQTGDVTRKESAVVSPYAGLLFDIDKQYTAYASYSDIFNPQSEKSAGGGQLKPVVGANFEAGVKGELLGGQLNVAAALFRLEQKNLATLDASVPYDTSNACGGSCYLAADKVVSRGVDLSASGRLQPGWNLAAGYTYVHSQYASGAQSGQRFMSSLPRHSLRVASSHQIAGTPWTVGGNVQATSGIFNTDGATYTIRRGGLALFGLTAKYRITPQADLTLVVDNLFDKRYYATVDSLWWSPFGAPRRLAVNLKYRL